MGSSIAEHHNWSDWGRLKRAIVAIAVIAAVLAALGVTRGGEAQGFHRLRMMVPNSPGGGYGMTARTAIIMEDDDITGRIEVFNVIGAGGTVAMNRLINEKGNDDLMMTMGLGVVGATYTNGSKVDNDATAIAKFVENPGAIYARRLAVQNSAGLRQGVEDRSLQGDDRRRLVARRPRPFVPDGNRAGGRRDSQRPSTSSPMTAAVICSSRCSAKKVTVGTSSPGG